MLDGQATICSVSNLGLPVGRLGRTNAFLSSPKPLSSPFFKTKMQVAPSEPQGWRSLVKVPSDHSVPFSCCLPCSPPNFSGLVFLSTTNKDSVPCSAALLSPLVDPVPRPWDGLFHSQHPGLREQRAERGELTSPDSP